MNVFSLQPWRWCNRDDIEEARDLCIQGHRQRSWPAPQAPEFVTTAPGWTVLAGAGIADIKLGICDGAPGPDARSASPAIGPPPPRRRVHPRAHRQLHRGHIAQGEHLIRRCQGWTDDMIRKAGLGTRGGLRVGGFAAKQSTLLPLGGKGNACKRRLPGARAGANLCSTTRRRPNGRHATPLPV